MMRSVLVLSMMLLLARVVWAESYGGGSGTAEAPYQIRTAEQMNAIGLHPGDWGSHFIVMNDIDMALLLDPESGSHEAYNIIGRGAEHPFSGTFDGNDRVISNVFYEERATADYYIGLFGYTGSTATVLNLGLKNVYFSSNEGNSIGALVGYNMGTIRGCSLIGASRGANCVGGLVGENWVSGTITGCEADVSVMGDENIGGLAGLNRGVITMCSASSSVWGISGIGGLVGKNYGSISTSYATGWLSGELFWTGGLAGLNSGDVTDCYADVSVNGGSFWSGGLVGWNSGPITDCYSAGAVSGSSYTGGFAGENYDAGAFGGCFWDMQTSGIGNGVGSGSSSGLAGKTREEMYMISTFIDAGWDLIAGSVSGTWRICSDGLDYPRFQWEFSLNGDLECRDGVALEDMLYLADRWLRDDCGANNHCDWADINADGIVNSRDFTTLADNWLDRKSPDIEWVAVNVFGWHPVEMSRYPTTNIQYAQYLNAALHSGHVTRDGNLIKGVKGLYPGQVYYQLYMLGHTGYGATNGGASRISYSDGTFRVDSGFENHPVTYVSWYGATSFADYYGWRLPEKFEWQETARCTDSRTYATGSSLYDSENFLANYRANGDTGYAPNDRPYHPWTEHGTSEVGYFGTFGYGLADMAGNVWNWTSTGPLGYRFVLGGGWDSNYPLCSVWTDASRTVDYMSHNQGFRVCR